MNINVYIFFKFVVIFFRIFWAFYETFCAYRPRTIRDAVADPSESAAETTTLNHDKECDKISEQHIKTQ